jgi:CPA2 family monovalent cation:H+ antiporter-2
MPLPHDVALIATVAMSLGYALIGGVIAAKLRLSPIVGYLLAGVAAGPFTPGFVADSGLAQQLAEIGVILLMFGVGMHFSIPELLAVKHIALPGAVVQMLVATALGAALALAWGWTLPGAIVFGLALSVASTVVLLRALEDSGTLASEAGHIAVGWLIVEDLAMVLALVLLPALAGSGGGSAGSLILGLGITLAKVAAFVLLMLLGGAKVLPWLLDQVARTGSRELFTLAIVAVALGVAFGSAELFGVSFALGAFFAGIVISASDHSQRAAKDSQPLQDAFGVLFFVSVGMLFDPATLIHEPLKVLAVVAIILFGKFAAALVIVLAFRRPMRFALSIAASLAQIGEFSFVLAVLGAHLQLLPAGAESLILAGAIISITVNPFVFALARRMGGDLAGDAKPSAAL